VVLDEEGRVEKTEFLFSVGEKSGGFVHAHIKGKKKRGRGMKKREKEEVPRGGEEGGRKQMGKKGRNCFCFDHNQKKKKEKDSQPAHAKGRASGSTEKSFRGNSCGGGKGKEGRAYAWTGKKKERRTRETGGRSFLGRRGKVRGLVGEKTQRRRRANK